MGDLSAKQLAVLKEKTRSAAQILLEDLKHFRTVAARRETSRAELRRLCADMRRLLVEREIAQIAAPRIGKVQICAPDYSVVYDIAASVQQVQFFGGASVKLFGVQMGPIFMFNAGTPPPGVAPEKIIQGILKGRKLYSEKRISLNLERFLAQPVLCLGGNWITRLEAIKHIAYWGHGVHAAGKARTRADEVAIAIRSSCSYGPTADGLHIQLFQRSPPWDLELKFDEQGERLAIEPSLASVDPLLVELLAAAQFLAESPKIIELEGLIQEECGAPSSTA